MDLWYTLLYLTRKEQRRVAQLRQGRWTEPLVRVGRSRSEAHRLVAEMTAWGESAHARGRAPSVERQVDWLSRRVHRRLPSDEIVRGLDGVIAGADVRDAPGGQDALRSLRRRGLPIGLVSTVMYESSQATRDLLRQHHLATELRTVVLSSDGTHSKPAVEPFGRALRRLRVAADECAHIGDDRFDVEGARAAGVRPILYTGLARFRPVARLGPPPEERRSTPILPHWSRLEETLAVPE